MGDEIEDVLSDDSSSSSDGNLEGTKIQNVEVSYAKPVSKLKMIKIVCRNLRVTNLFPVTLPMATSESLPSWSQTTTPLTSTLLGVHRTTTPMTT